MLLIIDHKDSFTFNLAQLFGAEGVEVSVVAAERASLDALRDRGYAGVVLSPGPGHPREAAATTALVGRLYGRVPLLGVCLGHQILCAARGAEMQLAREPVHGQACSIDHIGTGLFAHLSRPIRAARYHSWVVRRTSLPADLEVAAWDADGQVMAVQDSSRAAFGVQFHPESFLTSQGRELARSFISLALAHGSEPVSEIVAHA